jgi:hypothetical protein
MPGVSITRLRSRSRRKLKRPRTACRRKLAFEPLQTFAFFLIIACYDLVVLSISLDIRNNHGTSSSFFWRLMYAFLVG